MSFQLQRVPVLVQVFGGTYVPVHRFCSRSSRPRRWVAAAPRRCQSPCCPARTSTSPVGGHGFDGPRDAPGSTHGLARQAPRRATWSCHRHRSPGSWCRRPCSRRCRWASSSPLLRRPIWSRRPPDEDASERSHRDRQQERNVTQVNHGHPPRGGRRARPTSIHAPGRIFRWIFRRSRWITESGNIRSRVVIRSR